MRYAFIESIVRQNIPEFSIFSIQDYCDILEVSSSGYFKWKHLNACSVQTASNKRGLVSNETVLDEMHRFRQKHRFTPGIQQFHAFLRNKGLSISKKRLRAVLRNSSFIGYRRRCRVKTTDSNHQLKIYPNLLERQFNSGQADKVWCADITYLPTQEGFVYFASVIDVGTRRLIGWAP